VRATAGGHLSAAAFSTTTRRIVHARSGGRCEGCRGEPATEMHHRLPRGQGGSHDPRKGLPCNALHLGPKCHRWAETNHPQVYELGWKIRHGADDDPCSIPATIHTPYGRGSWLLTEDGMFLTPETPF
jgi:5-methylcytosine-specific restriction protein A